MTKPVTVRMIADIVAAFFNLDRQSMLTSRKPTCQTARYITFWACCRYTPYNNNMIGRLLGGHYGGHIAVGTRSVNNRIDQDSEFELMVERIQHLIDASISAVETTDISLKTDPDPLVIAERVLSGDYNATLISINDIKVLATAVVVSFGTKEAENAQH